MFENYKVYETTLAGRPLKLETGKMAGLANGSCWIRYGESVVMVNVTASPKPRDGVDFFPLSVDYEEKLYSVGKIPGGFLKREGRPSEKAILTSRVVDRPMRPLFPKDMRNDVAIVMTVLAVDPDTQPEILSMIGASVAVTISDIPWNGPIGGVFMGLVDGKIVVNPTAEQRKALLQSLDHLMQGRYSLSFKVIVPTAEECDDPQRLQTAAAYPYFALGTAEQSTGKLRSLPDARQTADIVLRPAQRILLRLYRHAGDEHSALFFEKQQATRDFVINHASAYSATNGYFTIPLPATDGTRTETFHIFLRPVLEVLTDDGLLPAAAPVHQTEYPQEELPIN